MTWIKLEDTLPDHERAISAGDRAMWLFVAGLCWCSRHLSDGRIPRAVAPRLVESDGEQLARKLVEVGLWRETKTAFVVRNYSKHQRTRDDVEAEREATRRRVAKFRSKRSGNAVTNGRETLQDTEADTDTPQTPLRGASEVEPLCTECRGTRMVPHSTDRHATVACTACKPAPPFALVEGGRT